jgi:hypothetical protein
MPKNAVTIFGLLVAVLPFLGFPSSFKSPAYFVLGVVIAYIGYYEHRHKRKPLTVRRVRRARDITSVPVSDALIEDGAKNITVLTNLVEPREEVRSKK